MRKKKKKSKQKIKLAIVIPCYPPHFKYLPRIFENISNQTQKADEIIVALSECSIEEEKKIEENLKKYNLKFEIISTEYKQKAGMNRNRGVVISECDYIMFLDADDEYHPQKIEITKHIIHTRNPNLILHNYQTEGDFEKLDKNKLMINNKLLVTKDNKILEKWDRDYNYKTFFSSENIENTEVMRIVHEKCLEKFSAAEIFMNRNNEEFFVNLKKFTENIKQNLFKTKLPTIIDENKNLLNIANGISVIKKKYI